MIDISSVHLKGCTPAGWRSLSPLEQAKASNQQAIEALVRWHWRRLARPNLTRLAEAYDLTNALTAMWTLFSADRFALTAGVS